MKILVCISHVPDTTSKINFTENDTKFDTNGVQFVINPNDEFGLTRAMWFKEKQGATVDIITEERLGAIAIPIQALTTPRPSKSLEKKSGFFRSQRFV